MAYEKQRRTAAPSRQRTFTVERVQTGVRLEKRILRVLRALAAYHDISLGDLLEGIVLHAFEGKPAFGRDGLDRIAELRRIYGLRIDASHSHRLVESGDDDDDEAPPREVATPAGRRASTRRGRRT